MKSRTLDFNFKDLSGPWSENKEFAAIQTGASIVPTFVEPYICRVMIKAKGMLPERLRQDVDVFIKQETQHYKNHILFNKAVAGGVAELRPIEKRLGDDYERLMRTRSLQFNLAYCEGFEAGTVVSMDIYFGDFAPLWKQSDPRVEALMKWHLAEEHEHRTVVHDVYGALYGRGLSAYVVRVAGFLYAMRHLATYTDAFGDVLLAHYRQGMTADELAESRTREKEIKTLSRKNWLRHFLKIISPSYSPAPRLPPKGLMPILELDQAPSPIPGSVHT